MRRRAAFFLALVPALAACGASSGPSVRLAMDGPPLSLVLQKDEALWTGVMDRGCMAGVGDITLRDATGDTACQGHLDQPANDKGYLHAELACSDGSTMVLAFRNLGPDQGMGIARISRETKKPGQAETPAPESAKAPEAVKDRKAPESPDTPLVLFYHPSPLEAERRLGQIREDIAAALSRKK